MDLVGVLLGKKGSKRIVVGTGIKLVSPGKRNSYIESASWEDTENTSEKIVKEKMVEIYTESNEKYFFDSAEIIQRYAINQ